MRVFNIEEPHRNAPPSNFALFTLGFRPFFLVAGVTAIILLALWVAAYLAGDVFVTYYGRVGWHGHEMIFGYAVAVIAGFLLTAVRNWTNVQTLAGGSLAALVTLWLAGRVLPFFSNIVPYWFIALVDIAFLPALATALAIPLVRARQTRNLIFVPLLGLMAAANIIVHLQVLGVTDTTAERGIGFAINLIILLIVIIGGRVIPFFTERALVGVTTQRRVVVEGLSIGTVIALALIELLFPDPRLVGMLAVLAAISHGVRLSGWYPARLWSVPMLWVLYLGYTWIITGFALKALAAASLVSPFLALHAFTVGGIGVMTMGMMSRVALGHTGRPLRPARAMVVAFVLINLAAMVRVLFPTAIPAWHTYFIALSGGLWIAAFLIFVETYTPILIRPRVDRQPG